MKKILKSNITELLKQSAKTQNVYAPIENEYGDTLFALLPKSGADLERMLKAVNLYDGFTVIPPKDIFFPQQEDMFHFSKNQVIEQVENSKKLIFGIKSCDLSGILFSDAFFDRNFSDFYYLSRSKDRLIITIGCLVPPNPQSCFCTSAKTGPFSERGYDLQLVDIGDAYLVEIGSEKGQEYTEEYPLLFEDAEENGWAIIEDIKREAQSNVTLQVDFDKALTIMQDENDFETIYTRIGERCIYCGGCLYTCPTCTCFNVFDESVGDQGIRRRIWDGCVFTGYTREASGHNPRREKWIRTARRYEHKLKYDLIATGESGCVGCGRCLSSCPVNIGMSKFIVEITENKRTM